MEYVDEKIFLNSKNGEYVVNGQTWMVKMKFHKEINNIKCNE